MMIDDLALYSKILSNEYKYEYAELSIIAGKVKDAIIKNSKRNDININIGKLPGCYCYPELFEIILKQLLSNAVKFNSNKPRISIRCKKISSKLTFEIEDNGIGIDSNYSVEIFKIFRKLHTINEYPGTGIGLAICKKIADLHDGAIWFNSSKKGGTVFFFTFSEKVSSKTLINN